MTKTLKENSTLYWTWLIMIACIGVGVVTTNLLSVLALGIFVLFAMFNPIIDSVVLLFGILPFANIFKTGAGATSFFTLCELLVIFLSVFKGKRLDGSFILSLLMFGVYIVAASLSDLIFLDVIKVLMGFYILYLATSNAEKKDVINMGYLIAISTILMMLLSLNVTYYEYVQPYLVDVNFLIDTSTGHESETMRLSGFYGDPNYCGVLIVMSVALLCVLYYYKQIKTGFWVFIAFLIPLGFSTYSKSYFLCISALVLFLIVFVLFPKYKGWAMVSIVVVIIVVSMTISGKIEIFNDILLRFTSEDITTGRAELNDYYLNYIWKHPNVLFFGEGISVARIASASNNVHNIYIEALFKLGIFGCLLYLLVLFTSARTQKPTIEKKKTVNYIPMLFFLILYSALAGIMLPDVPMYIAMAVLAKDFNSLGDGTHNSELNKETK